MVSTTRWEKPDPAFVRTVAEIDTRIRYLLPLLARTPQEVKP
ncbi:hypothetical protein [Streptomyces sp. uw30]|nr:hypothetical protein [Streptomyces sp. uw30]